MIPAFQQKNRRVVPRWRDSSIAAVTGELTPLQLRSTIQGSANNELATLITKWRENRSVSYASDLLAAAMVLDLRDNNDVVDAIEFIFSLGMDASSMVLALAESIIADNHDISNELSSPLTEYTLVNDTYEKIRKKKIVLRRQPRNTLAWVDISRYYATLGQDAKALSSMSNALILSPNNRFVLRSAARMYVHTGDLERGYDLLRRNPSTRFDPWLRSAEIVLADLMEKTPSRLGHTRRLLHATDLPPLHLSELASAVATYDLRAGAVRSARRLFNLSLTDPTENAVAQSEWARKHVDGISMSSEHLYLPRTFEVRTWNYFQKLQLDECFEECMYWLMDEPFSLAPVAIGMFIAMMALEDHQKAVDVGGWGLKSHPDNFMLRNNLTIAYAELNQIDKAMRQYRSINPEGLSSFERICWLATQGLLEFRTLSYEKGRQLYLQAIEEASDHSNILTEAIALVFWACEELRAGEMKRAEKIAHRLNGLVDRFKSLGPEFDVARSKLDRMLEDRIRQT